MAVKTTIIPSLRQVIYDTYANFPSAGLAKGDLAWATDREYLYRWSGSAWQTISISKASAEGKASDDLQNSNDTERTAVSQSYVKTKEIKFNEAFDGEMRIKFDMKGSAGLTDFRGKIYKNGSLVGTEQHDSGNEYVTFSEDLELTLAVDDLLQIYSKADEAGHTHFVKNFRLYYNGLITELAGHTLVTELLCTISAVSTTNQDP